MPLSLTRETALAAGVDLRPEPVERRGDVFHLEIGVDRVGEDRVQDLALMVVHGRVSRQRRLYRKIDLPPCFKLSPAGVNAPTFTLGRRVR